MLQVFWRDNARRKIASRQHGKLKLRLCVTDGLSLSILQVGQCLRSRTSGASLRVHPIDTDLCQINILIIAEALIRPNA